MVNRDPLEDEHEVLKREVQALQREHEELRKRPHDMAGHKAHRERLELKIAELRAHMARLKAES